jgi:2,3,4,5-tetrahydropyridine-2,6-dicarboxylate N-succinyltransferase
MKDIIETINWAWEDAIRFSDERVPSAIRQIINGLNDGSIRVCEKIEGKWHINQWVKKAILMYFRTQQHTLLSLGTPYYDKIALKTHHWTEQDFQMAGVRLVPGAIVREGTFIDKNTVIMPSFINIGAHVGSGTMIDTWSTIGSCAYIGQDCHISGGVGIGGVLEPVQALPVIIEDNCFIGARSEIAEGVIVEEGSVISMGVFISASTKIIDRETGEVFYGRVPSYSVVIPGSQPTKNNLNLACAVIVKRVDERTRSKTSINELLRD